MEGANSPLLGSPGGKFNGDGGRVGLSRGNSVNSLRNDFISRLPEKFRPAVDAEFPSDIDLSRASNLTPGEKEYYEKQFATLESFEEVERIVNSDSPEEDDKEQAQHERAMRISNYANVMLLAFKDFKS